MSKGETYKRGDNVRFVKHGIRSKGYVWEDDGGEIVVVMVNHRAARGKTVIGTKTKVNRKAIEEI